MSNSKKDGDIQALSNFLQNLKRKGGDGDSKKINLRDLSSNEQKNLVSHIAVLKQQRQKNYNGMNSGGRSDDSTKSFQPMHVFRCKECDLTCSSQQNLNQHKKGKRHAMSVGKLDEIIDKDKLPPEERSKIALKTLGPNNDYIVLAKVSSNGICRYMCKLCDLHIFEPDLDLHLKGRKHLEKLENTAGVKQPKTLIRPDANMLSPNKIQKLSEKIKEKNQLQSPQQPSSSAHEQYFSKEGNPTHKSLEVRSKSLDQRERILDLRERRLILRESECAKREEEVAQREVKLRLQEVKLLSSTYNQPSAKNDMLIRRLKGITDSSTNENDISSLTSSEQKYYKELMSQKNEILIAFNTISDKGLLTMEERLAKSKLKLALEDIQLAMNNLQRKKNINTGEFGEKIPVPEKEEETLTLSERVKKSHEAKLAASNTPSTSYGDNLKSPGAKSDISDVSKDDLKKQMEEKLLQAMNGGSLAQLAKVIAKTPSMKAALMKINKKSEEESKTSDEKKPDESKEDIDIIEMEDANPDVTKEANKLADNEPQPVPAPQRGPLIGHHPSMVIKPRLKRPISAAQHNFQRSFQHHGYLEEHQAHGDGGYYGQQEHYEESLDGYHQEENYNEDVNYYNQPEPMDRHPGALLPSPAGIRPRYSGKPLILPDVGKHGVRPHPSRLRLRPGALIRAPRPKRPLLEHPSYHGYY